MPSPKAALLGLMLKALPRNHLSSATGWLAHRKLPGPLGPLSVRWFARRYAIRLDEAEKAIGDYPTIAALFTRELKKGARPIGAGFAVSPADSVLTQFGEVGGEGLVQAKGKTYTAAALLGDSTGATIFDGGHYATFYLCPTDYHRVHSPVDGEVFAARHLPGTLWPVNAWSVSHVPGLFPRNERVVTCLRTARGCVAVVMVGATNVGKMTVAYDSDLVTNRRDRRAELARDYVPPVPIRKGDPLGVFHMGSTVVVLFEKGVLRSPKVRIGESTRMGESLDE